MMLFAEQPNSKALGIIFQNCLFFVISSNPLRIRYRNSDVKVFLIDTEHICIPTEIYTTTPRTDEFCTVARMNLLVDYTNYGQ